MYQALYRKWRPRVFADVVGQDHVTRTLRRQVAEGRMSHAYLFTGTRGTGKTTCAKILSRAVNCERPVDGDPCGECPSCRGLEEGRFLDVLELDAASNNGVDQVRALRDEAVYPPANVRERVYIVDEVHMLSVPAFNALLKILEEPPGHLLFILATTELHKVPATILSRCQRYAFRRIRPGDIQARLSYVAAQEGIGLTEDGAALLSRLADGALRDALSLLDQCAAPGGAVDSAAVLETLGLAGSLRTAELLDRIARRDAASALSLLGELYEGGKDPGTVLREVSGLVRDLLLRRTAPEGSGSLLSGGFDDETLDRLGRGAGGSRLLYWASVLQKALSDLSYSADRRTDAELCVLRLCDETLSEGLEALSARVEALEAAVRSGTVPGPPRPATGPSSPPGTAVREARSPSTGRPPVDALPTPGSSPAGASATPGPSPPDASDDDAPPWDDVPPPEDLDAPPSVPEDRPVPAVPEIPAISDGPRPAIPAGPTVPDGPRPAIPDASRKTAVPADGDAALSGAPADWKGLMERCRPRLPPMYRPFLGNCTGVTEGDTLVVHAPDGITLGRLDNDRVRGVLMEESGAARVLFREGAPPTPEENLRELVRTCRGRPGIEITGGADGT